jgi:hypothetical protein
MTDRAAAEDWFRRYRVAWESNEDADIRGLFTDDAVYNYHPHEPDPVVGVDAIVASWLENRDEPGATEFDWKLLAVDGEIAIAQCVTTYVRAEPPRTYDNLWVVRLAGDGRATEFTEWYIQRQDQGVE